MPTDSYQTLFEVSQLLNSILEPGPLMERVMDEAVRVTGAERGLLVLRDPDTGALDVKVARRIEGSIEKVLSELSQSALQEALKTREARLYLDAPGAFPAAQSVIIPQVRSIACVPLISREQVIGAIYLDSRTDRHVFTDDALLFLKSFANIAALSIVNARLHESLVRESSDLREAVREWPQFPEMVGNSPAIRKVFQLMSRVIPTEVPVLISGETGTGKELVARAIHYNGPRQEGPFVAVNCGAIPENLLESELFGYRRGAFTGANADKKGLFEAAHGGTLLLDEVGDLPLALQPKLLRALQDGEVRRVGDTASLRVDVRVVSATNQKLPELIRQGRFREDLYYRLNVIPIELPPLRHRRDDIPLLAHHFLKRSASRLGKSLTGIRRDALSRLLDYAWPGNIRQLENVIERAAVLSTGDRLTADDIVLSETCEPATRPDATKEELEKQIVLERLKQLGGNRTRTAESLGISRRTLQNRLREWGVGSSE